MASVADCEEEGADDMAGTFDTVTSEVHHFSKEEVLDAEQGGKPGVSLPLGYTAAPPLDTPWYSRHAFICH